MTHESITSGPERQSSTSDVSGEHFGAERGQESYTEARPEPTLFVASLGPAEYTNDKEAADRKLVEDWKTYSLERINRLMDRVRQVHSGLANQDGMSVSRMWAELARLSNEKHSVIAEAARMRSQILAVASENRINRFRQPISASNTGARQVFNDSVFQDGTGVSAIPANQETDPDRQRDAELFEQILTTRQSVELFTEAERVDLEAFCDRLLLEAVLPDATDFLKLTAKKIAGLRSLMELPTGDKNLLLNSIQILKTHYERWSVVESEREEAARGRAEARRQVQEKADAEQVAHDRKMKLANDIVAIAEQSIYLADVSPAAQAFKAEMMQVLEESAGTDQEEAYQKALAVQARYEESTATQPSLQSESSDAENDYVIDGTGPVAASPVSLDVNSVETISVLEGPGPDQETGRDTFETVDITTLVELARESNAFVSLLLRSYAYSATRTPLVERFHILVLDTLGKVDTKGPAAVFREILALKQQFAKQQEFPG